MSDLGRTPRRWELKRHPASVRGKVSFIGKGPRLNITERVRVREDRVYEEDIEKAKKTIATAVFDRPLGNLAPHERFDCEVAARAALGAVLGGSDDNE